MAPRVHITSKTMPYVEPEPVVDNKDTCFSPFIDPSNVVYDLYDWDIPDPHTTYDLSNWDFV